MRSESPELKLALSRLLLALALGPLALRAEDEDEDELKDSTAQHHRRTEHSNTISQASPRPLKL